MTDYDDFMYQLGWLLGPLVLFLFVVLLRHLRVASSAVEAVPDAAAAPQEAVAGDALTEKAKPLAEKLYDVLWGNGRPRACVDAATVMGAVVNLVLFGAATEAVFRSDRSLSNSRVFGLSADSLVVAHDAVEIMSVIAFGGVLLARLVAAQAHPRFKRSGSRAW